MSCRGCAVPCTGGAKANFRGSRSFGKSAYMLVYIRKDSLRDVMFEKGGQPRPGSDVATAGAAPVAAAAAAAAAAPSGTAAGVTGTDDTVAQPSSADAAMDVEASTGATGDPGVDAGGEGAKEKAGAEEDTQSVDVNVGSDEEAKQGGPAGWTAMSRRRWRGERVPVREKGSVIRSNHDTERG